MVVEAPMGLGKTEAALDLFDRAARDAGQTGVFVGLPTQATANGLFDRLAQERFVFRHGNGIVGFALRRRGIDRIRERDGFLEILAPKIS